MIGGEKRFVSQRLLHRNGDSVVAAINLGYCCGVAGIFMNQLQAHFGGDRNLCCHRIKHALQHTTQQGLVMGRSQQMAGEGFKLIIGDQRLQLG